MFLQGHTLKTGLRIFPQKLNSNILQSNESSNHKNKMRFFKTNITELSSCSLFLETWLEKRHWNYFEEENEYKSNCSWDENNNDVMIKCMAIHVPPMMAWPNAWQYMCLLWWHDQMHGNPCASYGGMTKCMAIHVPPMVACTIS